MNRETYSLCNTQHEAVTVSKVLHVQSGSGRQYRLTYQFAGLRVVPAKHLSTSYTGHVELEANRYRLNALTSNTSNTLNFTDSTH